MRTRLASLVLAFSFMLAIPALALPPQCTVSNGYCTSTYTDIDGPEVFLNIYCVDGDTWSGAFIGDINDWCTPTSD